MKNQTIRGSQHCLVAIGHTFFGTVSRTIVCHQLCWARTFPGRKHTKKEKSRGSASWMVYTCGMALFCGKKVGKMQPWSQCALMWCWRRYGKQVLRFSDLWSYTISSGTYKLGSIYNVGLLCCQKDLKVCGLYKKSKLLGWLFQRLIGGPWRDL